MKKKGTRILALIAAVALPALYVIATVLILAGNPVGRVLFAIAFGSSFFLAPILYLVTKFPKDMAEIWVTISDKWKKKGR